jgi:serine/threonine-protein kinase
MQAGTVLRDKYQLVATIGRGGMGEVFHAVHLPSGTDVAVKVVNREIVDEMMMARLEREAAAATRIQSPYVPRVLDVDRLHTGELFLVMELLHGETFSERLKRGGVLSWDEVFHIGDNVLRGLIHAHEAGVVHRDLKPGNVFIEHLDGGMARARVLDFGVCKLDEQDTKKLTITGESVGTIAYMAPEQIRGASKVDERADLYSFAMIVYEALAGRLPYDAQGQMALLATKLERPARALRGFNLVAVPPQLDALLTRALSRKPSDRPANAREMLRAWQGLGPATSQPNPQAAAAAANGSGSSSPPTQVAVTAGVRSTLSGPRRKPAVALGLAIALVASVLVVTAVRRSPAAAPAIDPAVAEPAQTESAHEPVVEPAALSPEVPAGEPSPSSEVSASATPTAARTVTPMSSEPIVELDDAAVRPRPPPHHASSPGPARSPARAQVTATKSSSPSPSPPSTSRKPSGPTLVEQPRY